ncbi:MAG: hypothetical protein Q9191_003412 [Dirinaria sp. TL-2023a]
MSDTSGDQENLAAHSAGTIGLTAQGRASISRVRSKSMGPGELESLRDGSGNGQKSPAIHQYKSILKPLNPVSPPKAVPSQKLNRNQSPRGTKQTVSHDGSRAGFLINTSAPTESDSNRLPSPRKTSAVPVAATFNHTEKQDHSRVAVRTEEEQQAAAKERERQEIAARRDARRKSLANRRVSFAPEATLHTWDVVEMPEDSTTSSASTNATRRASSLSTAAASPYPQPGFPVLSSDAAEDPPTPVMQEEQVQVNASPAHQRNLHQTKRRRISGIPPMNFNNPDDFSSSPYSGDSANSDEAGGTFMADQELASSSDSDDKDLVEDETITGVDSEDVTSRSNGSFSTGSSGRLEEALRQAARQAGTQGIEFDENGDVTMEMADDEVTTAFRPEVGDDTKVFEVDGKHKEPQRPQNIDQFLLASPATINASATGESEQTMEFTRAIGKILQPDRIVSESSDPTSYKGRTTDRHRSNITRRRSSSSSSDHGGGVMDPAVGGTGPIEKPFKVPQFVGPPLNDEEELTMDITTAIGGILSNDHPNRLRTSDLSMCDDEEMDVTVAVGAILPNITESTEPAADETMGMDITVATGAILPKQLSATNQGRITKCLQKDSNNSRPSEPSKYDKNSKQAPSRTDVSEPRVPELVRTTASETGSPSLVITEGRNSKKKNTVPRQSMTPKTTPRRSTPLKKPATPSKQSTLKAVKPTTPGKTPPPKNVSLRTGSPKKLFTTQIEKAAANSVTETSGSDKSQTVDVIADPNTIDKTHVRRLSGLGVDRTGMGSPRVSALLDARGSIGDDAEPFVAGKRLKADIRFADPQIVQEDAEQELSEEVGRQSGRRILQKEVDEQDLEVEKDATSDLKGKIESLTPQKKKKSKLSGRKSLHVGTAKGVLGKRPAELDEVEDEDESTPKRLRGMGGSPVKEIKLPAPPLNVATNGRITRSTRVSLGEIGANARPSTPSQSASPAKSNRITTPRDQSRYKNVKAGASLSPVKISMTGTNGHIEPIAEPSAGEDRIRLQDFLNLTSIRFMDLTTTKRRHTLAPNCSFESSAQNDRLNETNGSVEDADSGLEVCIVAGTCTLPLLDLYQHSCRELKKYITEGRGIVREIEEETFDENPPLFYEYISALPEVKCVMDNQFKNVKTHARLLSKAMWYEWRMKLLDGLKEGLVKTGEGIEEDAVVLAQQEQLIRAVLPNLVTESDELEAEARDLQARANDLADCDQEELGDARSNLVAVEEEAIAKRKMAEDLQSQLARREKELDKVSERRHECILRIQEAEKMKKDSQGWNPSQVNSLQVGVTALEREHGWTIVSATDTFLIMAYKGTLQLHFMPQSFQHRHGNRRAAPPHANSPISLTYIADAHEHHSHPLTTEKRFFLQIMRAQLQFVEQSKVPIHRVLEFVSNSWEEACHIANESRLLGVQYLTTSMILSDETMAIRSAVLLRAIKTKIDVQFEITCRCGDGVEGIEVIVKPSALVVYGEELNMKKMGDYLKQRMGHGDHGKDRDGVRWVNAINGLKEHFATRRKKS